jgi:myo-inositol-1(or 4)-monophosphatase
LRRITSDGERIDAQRTAAQFALGVHAQMQPAVLPDGALEFARALAHDTGRFLLASFGAATADIKRDGTLVTQFDLESDRRLSAAILTRYPSHTVLSEERDRVYKGQEWCWVIDPIDGTTNYTWGYPCWGVLIGLLHDGYPVMGVAEFPHTHEQFYAVHGEGAWLNGSRLKTLQVDVDAQGRPQFAPTHLFACCTRTLNHGIPNVSMKVRLPGSAGYNLALVAIMTTQPIFPLRMGADYAEVTFGVLAGCSPAAVGLLAESLNDRFVASP